MIGVAPSVRNRAAGASGSNTGLSVTGGTVIAVISVEGDSVLVDISAATPAAYVGSYEVPVADLADGYHLLVGPVIAGTGEEGETLTAYPPIWLVDPALYAAEGAVFSSDGQWHRDGAPIPGATSMSRVVAFDDGAADLTFVETPKAPNGSDGTPAVSNAIAVAATIPEAPVIDTGSRIVKWDLEAPGVLWQDASRTIPATADGDPVAVLADSGPAINDQPVDLVFDGAARPTLRFDGARPYLDFTVSSNGHSFLRNLANQDEGHLVCLVVSGMPGGGADNQILDTDRRRRFSQRVAFRSGNDAEVVYARASEGVRQMHCHWCPSGPSALENVARLNGGELAVLSADPGDLEGGSASRAFMKNLTGQFHGGWACNGDYTAEQRDQLEAYWAYRTDTPRAYMRFEGRFTGVDEDYDGLWPMEVGGTVLGVVCCNSSTTVRTVFWLEKPASPGGIWTKHPIATLSVGAQPEGVVAADIDGDGRIEVFVCGQTDNSLHIFKPDTSDHTGTWSGAVLDAAATDSQSVLIFDHDNDGVPGVLYSCEANAGPGGGVYVLDWDGVGDVLNPASWTKRTLHEQRGAWHIASVIPDLTGDGVRNNPVFTIRETPFSLSWLEPGADPNQPWTRNDISTSQRWNFCAVGEIDGAWSVTGTQHPQAGSGSFSLFTQTAPGNNWSEQVLRTGDGSYHTGIFHLDGEPVIYEYSGNFDIYAQSFGGEWVQVQRESSPILAKPQENPIIFDPWGDGPIMAVVNASDSNGDVFWWRPWINGQQATTGAAG